MKTRQLMLRVALSLATLCTLATAPGRAHAAPPQEEESLDALLAAVDDAAGRGLVQALVAHPLVCSSPEAAQRVVEALACGGVAATEGLITLSAHNDSAVRAEALRRIGSLRLRTAAAARRVRECLEDRQSLVREAACAALGGVGERQDVPTLIQGLDATGEPTRAGAHVALRALTGTSMPGVASQWEYWWSLTQVDLPARLEAARAEIDRGTPTGASADARRLLCSTAWFDVEGLLGALRVWLAHPDSRCRVAALAIAAGARLGDFADEVEATLKIERDPEVLAAAREAARVLGCRAAPTLPRRATGSDPESPVRHEADLLGDAGPREIEGAPSEPAPTEPMRAEEPEAAVLTAARDLLQQGRISEAHDLLLAALRGAQSPAESAAARNGFAAVAWLQRIGRAAPRGAEALRAQARRSLSGTMWEALF